MARRGFRFSRILRLKTQLRKVAQDEIGRMRQDLADVERGIVDAEAAQARNRAAATQGALEGLTARDLQLHEAYDLGQRATGQALQRQADALGEVIESQRGILLDRRREERQFECLESRQREGEVVTEARKDANTQDDLARRMNRGQQATRKPVTGGRCSGDPFTSEPGGTSSRRSPTREPTS